MIPIVAIVAQGLMGAGLAGELTARGVRVLTSLEGRSPASAQRARAAGMQPVSFQELATADLLLSIMPPANALPFAQEVGPLLAAVERPPVFVDCNAISPATSGLIGKRMEELGVPYVDAGIIGLPPRQGMPAPRVYVSGLQAPKVCILNEYGLDVRLMDAPAGAASALKLSYAGITKGLIAVASSMILGATRGSVADALREELQQSEAVLLQSLSQRVQAMPSRAYRWVEEMRQIEEFLGADPAAAGMYRSIAELYARLAADFSHDQHECDALEDFFAGKSNGAR